MRKCASRDLSPFGRDKAPASGPFFDTPLPACGTHKTLVSLVAVWNAIVKDVLVVVFNITPPPTKYWWRCTECRTTINFPKDGLLGPIYCWRCATNLVTLNVGTYGGFPFFAIQLLL
jgi:hypothetical protein